MASTLYPEVAGNQHVDLDTRKAVIAAQQGQALTPYQLNRLANRQAIEEENSRGGSPIYGAAATSNSIATRNAEAVGAVGPRGIDVNSYVGSIYAPGGAVAKPGYRPQPSAELAADSALRGRFGAPPNERGQIDIAGAGGSRSIPNSAAMGTLATESDPSPGAGSSAPAAQLVATPYLPAPAGALGTMLKGSRLDPGVRELGEQVTRANLEATRVGTLATQSGLEDRARSGTAARAAIEPGADGTEPTADEILRNYIRNGGRVDPSIIVAAAKPGRETPRLVDVGGGRQALTGSAQLVPKDTPSQAELVPLEVGGRKMSYHPASKRYFDETGKPVDFAAERPPRAPDMMMKTLDPELYDAQRAEYLAYTKNGDRSSGGGKPAAAAAPKFSSKFEGKKVRGPDGESYLIKDGKPVLAK